MSRGRTCPPFLATFGALLKRFSLVCYILYLPLFIFSCATLERTEGSRVNNEMQIKSQSPTINEDSKILNQEFDELLNLTEEILEDYETVVDLNEDLLEKNETLKKVSRFSIIGNFALLLGLILVAF